MRKPLVVVGVLFLSVLMAVVWEPHLGGDKITRVTVLSGTDGVHRIWFSVFVEEHYGSGYTREIYREWEYDFSPAVLMESYPDGEVISDNITGIFQVNTTVYLLEWDSFLNVTVVFVYFDPDSPLSTWTADYVVANYSVREV